MLDPIAIVGIGCKLPGGIRSVEDFWSKLLSGADVVSDTPPDRWNTSTYFHPNRNVPGCTYARWAGYVTDPTGFDAAFFGLTPREAMRIDPQQRWLLETAWEALENAGIPPMELAGSPVGVFVGISSCDYGDIQKRGRYLVDLHTTSGSALSIASNRISYQLDLRGPSFSVDTACSSSLVALDLACQSIWRGEVPLALLGGVNAILDPNVTVGFAKGGFLSPTGRCHTFDAAADGFVRGEGAAVVVLKPLSQAKADGDHVYAVIHSTATNQDGRTSSLTVPSAEQQQALLEEAYRRAGVKPENVGYIEAHGTGTVVGDRIEAEALGRAIGIHRPKDKGLWVGSVKTNLGHLEPASGIVGLIKLALSIHHRTIPPNVHFVNPNPHIPFDDYRLRVPTTIIPWEPSPDGFVYGGVNSFGFGGANAHAVLSSPPDLPNFIESANSAPNVWTVSARSSTALIEAAEKDAQFLTQSRVTYRELVKNVQSRRSHHSHRVAVVADDAASAAEKLNAFASGTTPVGAFTGQTNLTAPAVAVVFSGQGTQWPGMGRDLFYTSSRFRESCEELDAIMAPIWGRSLIEELLRGDDSVYEAERGQPILFAVQVGLGRLYLDAGVRPVLFMGHSFGEVAAAYFSGALPLQDATRVIVERAKALELTKGAGGMAAVGITETEAKDIVSRYPNWLSVAAINSDVDLTLAGDMTSIEAVVAELTRQNRFARTLPFPYAFHSKAVEQCREVFLKGVAGLHASSPRFPFVSALLGREINGDIPNEDYWWKNMRNPVQFSTAIRRAEELGAKVFLEVGPHPGLVRYVKQLVGESPNSLVLGSLRRNESGPQCLAESLAALHVAGVNLDWKHGNNIGHVSLPGYPWQRQTFWLECDDSRHQRLESPTHPLLGVRETGPIKEWNSCLNVDQHHYLADHGFRGRAVFPAAGHIELMVAAAAEGSFAQPVGLTDIHFERILWADQPHEVRTTFDTNARRLTVSARSVEDTGRGWEQCSRSVTWMAAVPDHISNVSMPHLIDARDVSPDDLYARFDRGGNHYGRLFRTIRRLEQAGNEIRSEISLDPELESESSRFFIHPTLLDGVFQSSLPLIGEDDERESMFVPVHIERIQWFRRAGSSVVSRIYNMHSQDVRWIADIDVFSTDGELVARFTQCCCLKKPQEAHVANSKTKLYHEEWTPAPRFTTEGTPPKAWLIIDPANRAEDLVRVLGGTWVGHQTDTNDLTAEFLQNANGEGAIVIWLPTLTGIPTVTAVADAIEPLLKVSQALATADQSGITLWLVTAGATFGHDTSPNMVQAPVAGMLRTVATELPQITCRLLDLDPLDVRDHISIALSELFSSTVEDEISYRHGERLAAQLSPVSPDALPLLSVPETQRSRSIYALRTTDPGNLDCLAWVETESAASDRSTTGNDSGMRNVSDNSTTLAAQEIEIEVRAVGINFRDVLKALDIYPLAPNESRSFGDECSGIVRRVGSAVTEFKPGTEVVAISVNGFGNLVRVPYILAAKKPANLTFEQAATIPIAFLTADYCLTDVARLETGETVLIHAAAGGVGQAAIQIARRAGAEIVGTASPDKHDLLRAQGVRHVFHSRNFSFVEGVQEATNGRGVDVVLNSLAGEFIPRTLELLTPGGRFVEIGKKDLFQNTSLDLNPFRASISFMAVDLAKLVARKPEWVGNRLRMLLDRFANGEFVPLDTTEFPADQVSDAFRLMAQGKHRGKLVLTIDPKQPPKKLLAFDRPMTRDDSSYLITGGNSGLGLRTAAWLAEQGAKYLILASRSGLTSDLAKETVAKIAADGVHVEVVQCDVSDQEAVLKLINSKPANRPPLRGVVHSAMVLKDELLPKVTRETLETVLTPKIAGAWNLHVATRELPLDWFIMYSSVATLMGSSAQSSYVAANRFLDALAWLRRKEGLPALALNWGALAEIGVVASNAALTRYLESIGLELLPVEDVFRFLKFLLRRDATSIGVARVEWERLLQTMPRGKKQQRLEAVVERRATDQLGTDGANSLLALNAAEDRVAFLVSHLRRRLAAVLRADEATLEPSAPLSTLGADSLMAFEFKLRIDNDFQTNIPIDKLSANTSIADLAQILINELGSKRDQSIESASSGTNEKAKRGASVVTPASHETASNGAVPVATQPQCVAHNFNDSDRASQDFIHIHHCTNADRTLENVVFDAAALLYLPDRINTVGGIPDNLLQTVFGDEPFLSHLYELPLGRIGVITLPIRGREMFHSERVPELVRKAADFARQRGAKCISLTGLIPSATNYGQDVVTWVGNSALHVTTGHATTTAAVIQNLQAMLANTDRRLEDEHLAVLGLGSIGRGCLSLALDALPHPRSLTLCDLITRKEELETLAGRLKVQFDYHGSVRILTSEQGLPEDFYEATTILTAVSVPDVIDVGRLHPGTIIVDDSYPPGFSLEQAIRRAEWEGDILFSNAGMTRLNVPVKETVFVPAGAEAAVARFGNEAFRSELARDPCELTACILSSLLTNRSEGFNATVGLAELADLRSHLRGLQRLGIAAARPQCGTYFVADQVVSRFKERFAAATMNAESKGS